MLGQGALSLLLTTALLHPQPAGPLSVSLAAGAQAMDARLQVRPTAQTEPAPAPAPEHKAGMSRGKKIAIAIGIVAGAALVWAALDNGDDNNTSGGGGGGY